VYGHVGSDDYVQKEGNFPRSVLHIDRITHGQIHPTQKPVPLFEYLIRTYTNPSELVLDNCIGSGTTAIACINADRRYIGFESDPGYFEAAEDRIQAHEKPVTELPVRKAANLDSAFEEAECGTIPLLWHFN
jgi:site-specific DNA-methyltransferase (adenine-specific)